MGFNILTFLGARSQIFIVGMSVALVFLISYIDFLTGIELSLSVFYLLPVAIAAWFASKWIAYFISVLSAINWFMADFLLLHVHLSALTPYWNAAARLAIFLIVAFILARLKESVETELTLAADIQRGFIPQDIPEIKGLEIAGSLQPSYAVSGDYYDVMKFDDSDVGFCVADVVGHGIPAAILMSSLQTAVKINASKETSPEDLCRKLNETIARNTVAGNFITFFFARLDLNNKRLTYANAGHNPPVIFHKDGSHSLMDKSDLVLGVTPEAEYSEHIVDLKSGDKLILFTDGVTELENPRGEQFGLTRLLTVLERNGELSADQLNRLILNELKKFSKGVFPDDVTLLIIKA